MKTSVAATGMQSGSIQAAEVTRGVSSAERHIRTNGQPVHSIVIASREPRRELEAHLHWLAGSAIPMPVEIVVARASEPTEMRSLRAAYPTVRFVALPKDTPMSELRAAGMSEAAGDIVTLLEDSVAMLPGRVAVVAGRLPSATRDGAIYDAVHGAERVVVVSGAGSDVPDVRVVAGGTQA